MVDSLDRLGHNSVVRGYNEDSDIGYLSSARAHCGERLVSGGIEEGDRSIVDGNSVRTDVLGDSACLARGNVSVADGVEDRGFTVVNVSHNNNYGSSAHEIRLVVLAVVDDLLLDRNNDFLFYLRVEFHRDK